MSGEPFDLDAIQRVMECRTRYQEIQPTGAIDPVCSEHGWLWPEGRAHCNKWSDERIALVAEVRRLREERAVVARHRCCRDCGATFEQCQRYRLGRAIKCCPDCHHAA